MVVAPVVFGTALTQQQRTPPSQIRSVESVVICAWTRLPNAMVLLPEHLAVWRKTSGGNGSLGMRRGCAFCLLAQCVNASATQARLLDLAARVRGCLIPNAEQPTVVAGSDVCFPLKLLWCGRYGHQTDGRGLADHDVSRNRTLGDVQFDRDLMHRIQGAQPQPRRLQQRFQREQRHHHHPNLYDPYGQAGQGVGGAVQRMPVTGTGRSRVGQPNQGRGHPVMEVSEPLHHNDLAYRSEHDVIEAKMERLQHRHRRGDGSYPAERRVGMMIDDIRGVPEAKVVALSSRSARRHAGSQSARSSNRGRVLARPKTSRHSSTGQQLRRHRPKSRKR